MKPMLHVNLDSAPVDQLNAENSISVSNLKHDHFLSYFRL